MRLLLFALLLTSPVDQIQGESHAGQPKSVPATHAQVAEPSHIVPDLISPQKNKQDAEDEKAKENREELRKNIEIFLTAAIFLAALAQAVFAGLQWRIYKHQLKTSMPLVIIDWENMIHLSPLTMEDIDSGGPTEMVHHFNWGVRNVGPTPAFVIETSARFIIVPTSDGIPKMDYADSKPYVGEPLLTEPKPVGGMNFYARLADDRTYEEIEAAYRGGKETLYAFGYVRFSDRYREKHTTSFCLRYYAWKELRREVDGFGVAGIKQNKYG